MLPAPSELRLPSTELVLPPPLPVPQAAIDDPAFRAFILPNVARLTVETGDAQPLSLQVRVHDGIADLRAVGPSAARLDPHLAELRLALTAEGLSLGQFDLDHSSSGSQRRDLEPDAPPTRASHRPTRSTTTHPEGLLSVKA